MAIATAIPLRLQSLFHSLHAVAASSWYLGFTSFGGPPVHFKIFHDKFVTKLGWIDEQMYQELFPLCQAFSGPGSTKLLYCIHLLHSGLPSAIVGFLIWSLPGALSMYALSLGISTITPPFPPPVYALLSGLNASTIGIILLAAVHLSQKAISSPLTRILVFLGATAGMLYNALWYFPVLMFAAGLASVVEGEGWLKPGARWAKSVYRRVRRGKETEEGNVGVELGDRQRGDVDGDSNGNPETTPRRSAMETREQGSDAHTNRSGAKTSRPQSSGLPISAQEAAPEPRIIPTARRIDITWQTGTAVITIFILSFVVIMLLRSLLPTPPLIYRLFANMYLAGTIIFGGGPVVIPLLREYVVAEGWVSPRDFLIGLALIQAFPGPNFNFAVYLGSLTAIGAGYPSAAGALLGYLGIFVPGLVTVHGEMGLWSALRDKRWVKSALRGVNAAAVGLIYTAVYRLWQIGFVDARFEAGASLGNDPWWVVITATSYVGGYWFGLNPVMAILLGAIMGLIRYSVVR